MEEDLYSGSSTEFGTDSDDSWLDSPSDAEMGGCGVASMPLEQHDRCSSTPAPPSPDVTVNQSEAVLDPDVFESHSAASSHSPPVSEVATPPAPKRNKGQVKPKKERRKTSEKCKCCNCHVIWKGNFN